MYYTYVIHSTSLSKYYIGYSADLKRRFLQHKRGEVHTTKRFGEIQLVFYEAFLNEKDARRREIYFKTTKGKRAIDLMLREWKKENTLSLNKDREN